MRFANDGRVFVAEKSGIIKVFDNLSDTTPTVFADLRTQVHNYWDRGLLGLALDPQFPSNPWVYVLYAHDAAIGGTAPRWGSADGTSDPCPSPTGNGCVVSGRLSRLQAAGNVMTGAEDVLIEDWCQQYPSHSIGSLAFGPDGALYVSGGEGAGFEFVDYGQGGSPTNPCGDPPVPVGGTQTSPSAEGGALRSQDRRTNTDPSVSTVRSCESIPSPATGCRATRGTRALTRTCAGSSRMASEIRFVSRSARARTRCGWVTWAGTTGRRSTASPTRPTAPSRTSGGPVTRVSADKAATTPPI